MKIVSETPAMVHCTHTKNGPNNAIIVKEKIIQTYVDGKVGYADNLKIWRDPIRSFYITKPAYRNHQYKKEYEDIDKLDEYNVPDSQLAPTLRELLGIRGNFNMSFKRLCDSPYVYGADIDTGVLLRASYKKKQGETIFPTTFGALDIENEVRGNKRINCITYIHENEIYTGVLEDYMQIKTDDGFVPANRQDLMDSIEKELGETLVEYGFKINVFIGKELDLIKWIFAQIHRCKTDFIGIWNMPYDIPHIIDRIDALGGDPVSIMCHPDVPKEYQFINFYKDDRTKDFRDKWDWFECPGYSQFIDSMRLYARIRKAKGRDSVYSLDFISNKELGTGKLSFGVITNHSYEQKNNFLRYVAYNIKDVLLMVLIERKNKDTNQLVSLTGVSMLKDFNKQTAMVKNNVYVYAKPLGKIIASAGTNMLTPFDKFLPKLGGAVADPTRTNGIGCAVLEESSVPTYVTMYVDDLDVASEYPTITAMFNISKGTKLSAAISIEGKTIVQMESLFGDITSPLENAVPIGVNIFGLPGYEKFQSLFCDYVTMKSQGKSADEALQSVLESVA